MSPIDPRLQITLSPLTTRVRVYIHLEDDHFPRDFKHLIVRYVTLMAVCFPFFFLSLRAADYENAIANVFGRLITERNKRGLRVTRVN